MSASTQTRAAAAPRVAAESRPAPWTARLYAISPTGVLRGARKTGGDVRGGPAIAEDGTVYASAFDGNLDAVHPGGTVGWSFATADRIQAAPTIEAAGGVR